MGVSITATNSKFDFYMGYGGFFNLRKNIAYALDPEFGAVYDRLRTCWTVSAFEENDREAQEVIDRKHLGDENADVLDFLYAPDTDGSISHKTCKKIYDIIKDVDFGNKGFRYAAYINCDYEEFKQFLKECYTKRRKMRWY